MEFIKEYKGYRILKGEQYSYYGYFAEWTGKSQWSIRAGKTLKEAYATINKLLKV